MDIYKIYYFSSFEILFSLHDHVSHILSRKHNFYKSIIYGS